MAVRQMLKLPPDLALTLLAFNRPLLNYHALMPQKLQVLQRVLGVTGARTQHACVRKELKHTAQPATAKLVLLHSGVALSVELSTVRCT